MSANFGVSECYLCCLFFLTNKQKIVCYCSLGLYTVLLICLKFNLEVAPHILTNVFLPAVFICHTAALKCGVKD